jgi:hypothetical protein
LGPALDRWIQNNQSFFYLCRYLFCL